MLSENAYSRPVTLKNVLRFAVPTIVMTVFMSFYTMAVSYTPLMCIRDSLCGVWDRHQSGAVEV